ncbi:MAG: hypothetical protein Q8N39_03175, partial [Pelolinea sp.]|nr:hypothetical protein [Pelolinea sp.]
PARKKGKDKKKPAAEMVEETPAEPEPTVMEIRLKEAMERSGLEDKRNSSRSKKDKGFSSEQEDLLSRTLSRRN